MRLFNIASLAPKISFIGPKQALIYAIFAECPVPWTGMNASGEVRGGEAIPTLAQCREAALLRKTERKLRRFTPRCPDLWSGSFTALFKKASSLTWPAPTPDISSLSIG